MVFQLRFFFFSKYRSSFSCRWLLVSRPIISSGLEALAVSCSSPETLNSRGFWVKRDYLSLLAALSHVLRDVLGLHHQRGHHQTSVVEAESASNGHILILQVLQVLSHHRLDVALVKLSVSGQFFLVHHLGPQVPLDALQVVCRSRQVFQEVRSGQWILPGVQQTRHHRLHLGRLAPHHEPRRWRVQRRTGRRRRLPGLRNDQVAVVHIAVVSVGLPFPALLRASAVFQTELLLRPCALDGDIVRVYPNLLQHARRLR